MVLARRSDSDLSQFLALAVDGLCAGGGSASGQEELSRPLLAQLVTSAGALLQLGVACPGWEAWASNYLELLLSMVWRYEAGPVPGAVLSGLKGVAAAMPAQVLRDGGRIADLAGKAAAWAMGLDGELREAATEVVLLLARKREGVLRKLVEKESLQPQQKGRMGFVDDCNQQPDISFGFDVNEERAARWRQRAAAVEPPSSSTSLSLAPPGRGFGAPSIFGGSGASTFRGSGAPIAGGPGASSVFGGSGASAFDSLGASAFRGSAALQCGSHLGLWGAKQLGPRLLRQELRLCWPC
jgi:hypothetical protein